MRTPMLSPCSRDALESRAVVDQRTADERSAVDHHAWGRNVAKAAALGLLLSACDKKPDSSPATGETTAAATAMASGMNPTSDKNCCMGKNDCKGKGGCAVAESHSCMGKNECKGKGGCNMHCPK